MFTIFALRRKDAASLIYLNNAAGLRPEAALQYARTDGLCTRQMVSISFFLHRNLYKETT